MPPEVLLVLASSGITLVASLLFFVSDEVAPIERTGPQLAFCLPPSRLVKSPPPLPVMPECSVDVSTSALQGTMTIKVQGDEWVVTLDTAPVADMPALQVNGTDGVGQVNDLRWHGKAGLARPMRRTWKQKPGRA